MRFDRGTCPSVRYAALAVVTTGVAACGGVSDPCEGIAGSCLAVRVVSSTADEVDELEIDLLYGDVHATTATQADAVRAVSLPVLTAVELDVPGEMALSVGLVVAGKLDGLVVGTGAASATVAPGERVDIDIRLAPAEECVPEGHYCGSNGVAGDPNTLYGCNSGGVPLARGICDFGCLVRDGDDACRGGGGPCVDTGFYCGGDKLDGDPQTLYRCQDGVGVDGMVCPDGCIVMPPGMDDECR
jgi:hypothetical protein